MHSRRGCGIAKGDIITHINGEKIDSTEEIQEIISRLGESTYTVRLLRSGKSIQLDGKSARAESDGTYRLGIWIRDSMAGIGTLTFYDPDSGVFGALGHGINDVDTSLLVPLSSGAIMESTVKAINGGKRKAGRLRGSSTTEDLVKLYAIPTAAYSAPLRSVP
jgi:stage IV sporulation protein B